MIDQDQFIAFTWKGYAKAHAEECPLSKCCIKQMIKACGPYIPEPDGKEKE